MEADAEKPATGRRWDGYAVDAASLISSASFGQLFIAWPNLAERHLGASPSQIGLIGALYQGFYVGSVLLSRRAAGTLDWRTQAVVSSLALTLGAVGMAFATTLNALFVLVSFFGVATSWLWPPVMGRVSTGLEGAALNRRLGRFNASWSSGMVLGPLMGGLLFDVHPTAPFWFAAVCHVISLGLFFVCAPLRTTATGDEPPSADAAATDRMIVYRRMARVAVVSGYVALGLLRIQLPGLANDLGVGATRQGLIGTFLSLTMAVGFALLGRHAWWHHKAGWMWAFQGGLGASLLLAYSASGAGSLFLCGGLAGVGISFLYASHLYYGVAGGRNRTARMAVHEILVSTGFLIGSFGGGVLAEAGTLATPYWVGCAVLQAGILVQAGIFAAHRRTQQDPK